MCKNLLSFCFVLISVLVKGQASNLDGIERTFESYRNAYLQEKLYVHIDRCNYLAGEIAWFKIYNVDASFHKPLVISSVAYVEILNNENKAILQAKVSLENGQGDGSFYLPISLASGSYRFRAYTRWMKNFSPEFFFETNISILNTLKELKYTAHNAEAKYDVQFFPEGGNIVVGSTTKMGFKVTNSSGVGIDAQGIIIDDREQIAAEFKSFKFGIGSFVFSPIKGKKYKAILNFDDGRKMTCSIPEIYEEGYSIALKEENEEVIVSVFSNKSNGLSPYLFVHSRNRIEYGSRVKIVNGKGEIVIPKVRLLDGISHFTLFDEERRPVCERLYFNDVDKGFEIKISTDSKEYQPRAKVVVNVFSSLTDSTPLPANMSVAIYRADSLQTNESSDIKSYLLLSSDLKGDIEHPEYYFLNRDSERTMAMDNLMLTHGWRKFQWEDVLSSVSFIPEFIPELNCHIVSGKVSNANSRSPANNIQTFLSIPGDRVQLFNAVSDSNGVVYFYTKGLYSTNYLTLQANHFSNDSFNIDIFNPFSERYSSRTLIQSPLLKHLGNTLLINSINMQTLNIYKKNYLSDYQDLQIDSIPFYGNIRETYLLKNYTRFPTVEEVLREYVLSVGVRNRRGKLAMQVYSGEVNKSFFDENPLILFNGVPVFKTESLFSFDPLKIKSVEVLAKKYFMGSSIFGGIIKFDTEKSNVENIELDPAAVVINYEGLQLRRQFYSPQYNTFENVNNRLPDFRNLLFWLPNLTTQKEGKGSFSFYTSDRVGNYIGVIQGITDDGLAAKYNFNIEVK